MMLNRSFWIILFILGIFISLGPVSAEHTTEIKALYFYNVAIDPHDLNDNVTFVHGKNPSIQTWLSVDGGEPQWYRYISLGIYDRYGKEMYYEEKCTWAFGYALFYPDFTSWPNGDYKMQFTYGGNTKDNYPQAEKKTKLHLT